MWQCCHFRRNLTRRRFSAMTTFILLIVAGLAVWGIVATLLRLASDGYGRPEIRNRNRHAEHLGDPVTR